jgi:hypothetical protein
MSRCEVELMLPMEPESLFVGDLSGDQSSSHPEYPRVIDELMTRATQ